MPEEKSDLVRVTGLWRDDAKGFIAGKINEEITIPAGARVMVFKNRYADGNKPTHNLCYSPPKESQPQHDDFGGDDKNDAPW